jgi:subtilisin family serine protease
MEKSMFVGPNESGKTGRKLIVLNAVPTAAAVAAVSQIVGREVPVSTDFDGVPVGTVGKHGGIIFHHIGVAVIAIDDEVQGRLYDSNVQSHVLAVEDERFVYAVDNEYLRGFKDAANAVYAGLTDVAVPRRLESNVDVAFDESQSTWGLQATGIVETRFAGKGVRIAVLDTGIDQQHPDFRGRLASMSFKAFIQNQSESVDDVLGHGTHCVGTACGPRTPATMPRYGIATDAEIYIGKVLDDSGQGVDKSVLAGIDWAISQKCDVISMSLAAPVQRGAPFSVAYETIAQRALATGTLIIAAAGNGSDRLHGTIAPVYQPANSPSIMAVAAVDNAFSIAPFSCAGPEIDIAGPGVNIYSSWPVPRSYNTISGTSMATPHVAGVAALWVEATGDRGAALRKRLIEAARPLMGGGASDVGAGLVQAPR